MSLPRIALVFVPVLALAACSSKQGGGNSTGGSQTQDPGITGDPQQIGGHDSNPQGLAYPTQHLGTSQRGLNGNVPATTTGDVIRNYKFLGYPGGDKTKPQAVVALADYYDPTASVKLLHIIVADRWCVPCNDETDALVKALADPTKAAMAQNIVFLQAIAEGITPNTAANWADVSYWMDLHHPTFTEVLDPEAANLGVFFDQAAVPWNANVDARSMEILSSAEGYDGSTDPITEQKVWLDWEAAHAPTYKPAQ